MDQLPRALVIAALILGGALIVRGLYPADRYSMVAVPGGAYRLDRLTGGVLFCDAALCRSLPLVAIVARPAAPPSPPPAPATGT